MIERAVIRECQETMLWEAETSTRQELVKVKSQRMANIDDTLSGTILTQRRTLRGEFVVWPWART